MRCVRVIHRRRILSLSFILFFLFFYLFFLFIFFYNFFFYFFIFLNFFCPSIFRAVLCFADEVFFWQVIHLVDLRSMNLEFVHRDRGPNKNGNIYSA